MSSFLGIKKTVSQHYIIIIFKVRSFLFVKLDYTLETIRMRFMIKTFRTQCFNADILVTT